MHHHPIHHQKEFQKFLSRNYYKKELYRLLDISLHNILYIYDHKVIFYCMDNYKLFYHTIHNIFLCSLNAYIYNCMVLYIIYMDLHIFEDILNENIEFYIKHCTEDNLNCTWYLSIHDYKHWSCHISIYILHEIFYLYIKSICFHIYDHILIIDYIFIYNQFLLSFCYNQQMINDHKVKVLFFMFNIRFFYNEHLQVIHNQLLFDIHKEVLL